LHAFLKAAAFEPAQKSISPRQVNLSTSQQQTNVDFFLVKVCASVRFNFLGVVPQLFATSGSTQYKR
jgi:hypothetical protein